MDKKIDSQKITDEKIIDEKNADTTTKEKKTKKQALKESKIKSDLKAFQSHETNVKIRNDALIDILLDYGFTKYVDCYIKDNLVVDSVTRSIWTINNCHSLDTLLLLYEYNLIEITDTSNESNKSNELNGLNE